MVVQVRDTAGAAVGGAQVTIIQRLAESRASGMTDDRGFVSLSLAASLKGDAEIVVRKLGWERGGLFFHAGDDALAFEVFLRPVVHELAPLVVTARTNVGRESYHVDADEIANSHATLIDATDILERLRPDMICGHACRPLEAGIARIRNPVRACPSLALLEPRAVCPATQSARPLGTNVWINGRRVRLVIPNEMALARQHGVLGALLPGTMTVLSELKPEHIAEMTYVDEFDTSVGKVGSNGALFVVLKPGVAYEPGRGSYVTSIDAQSNARVAESPVLPLYRLRILGVFDDDTGKPIEGANVIDLNTGTYGTTTVTGTVSLVFLPEGGSPVRITKPGYDDLTVAVEISPDERQPLTLLMTKSGTKTPE